MARKRRVESSWVGSSRVGISRVGTSRVATDFPTGWLCTGWLVGWLAGLIHFATDLPLSWFKDLGTKRQKIDKKGTKKSTHPRKNLKFYMKK